MKRFILIFLCLMSMSSFPAFSQDTLVRFFANDSAFQIKDVTCNSFDSIYNVIVTIPVPENISEYDCFFIHLSAEKNMHTYFSKTYYHDEIISTLVGKKSIKFLLCSSDKDKSDFDFWYNDLTYKCKKENLKGEPWEIVEIEAKPMNTYSTYNGDPVYTGNVYCKGQLIIRKTE